MYYFTLLSVLFHSRYAISLFLCCFTSPMLFQCNRRLTDIISMGNLRSILVRVMYLHGLMEWSNGIRILTLNATGFEKTHPFAHDLTLSPMNCQGTNGLDVLS